MKKGKKTFIQIFFLSFVVLFVVGAALPTLAQDYTPLAPLPGIETAQPIELGNYINQMFRLIVGLASVLAVLMIVVGGIQYMMSEAVGSKSEAKKRIWAAVIGLLLAISSVLILQTINPDLLKLDLDIKVKVTPKEQGVTGVTGVTTITEDGVTIIAENTAFSFTWFDSEDVAHEEIFNFGSSRENYDACFKAQKEKRLSIRTGVKILPTCHFIEKN